MQAKREEFRPPRQATTVDDFIRVALEKWDLRPEPISLPESVVERTGPKRSGDRVPVRVMMPIKVFFETTIELEGVVTDWTSRAVRVSATMPDGRVIDGWVWANAVDRIEPPEPKPGR